MSVKKMTKGFVLLLGNFLEDIYLRDIDRKVENCYNVDETLEVIVKELRGSLDIFAPMKVYQNRRK